MRGSVVCLVVSNALAGCWHGHRDDSDTCAVVLVRPGNVNEDVGIRPTLRLEWNTAVDIENARVRLRELGGREIPATVDAQSDSVAAVTTDHSLRFDTVYTIEVEPVAARDEDEGTCLGSTTSFHTLTPYEVEQPLRAASLESLAQVDHYLLGSSRAYRGLQVFDILAPDAPELVATMPTDVHASSVSVLGSRAYVPAELDGVLIVDISDPQAPKQLGRVGTPGMARATAPFERDGISYLAIADGVEGVRIVDVSDPIDPRTVSVFDPSGSRAADVRALDIEGNLLAVADGIHGFVVVDLSSPASPQRIGSGWSGLDAIDVAFVGGLLYVAHWPTYVDVYDPRQSDLPRVGGVRACDVCMQRYPVMIHEAGNRLHVTAAREGVRTYELDGAGGMSLVGYRLTQGPALAVVETNQRLYVGEEGGIIVFDAATVGAPRFFDERGHGTASSVSIVGDVAYVAASSRGLQTFRLDDLEVPRLVASTPTAASASGDISAAFVTSISSSILVGDVRGGLVSFERTSQQMPPTMRGQVQAHDGVTKLVEVAPDIVLGCQGNTGMLLADVANPAAPQVIAESFFRDYTPPVPDYCNDLVFDETTQLAYVAGSVGITVLDLANTSGSEPLRVVGRFALPSHDVIASLVRNGRFLYAATRVKDFEGRHGVSNRLQVLDISDPARPIWTSASGDLGEIGGLTLVDDKLFAASKDLGVYVFDASNAESPEVEYLISTRGDAVSLAATADSLYVAESSGGLGVIHTGPLPIER